VKSALFFWILYDLAIKQPEKGYNADCPGGLRKQKPSKNTLKLAQSKKKSNKKNSYSLVMVEAYEFTTASRHI
jgi:hypothetical protein